MAGSAAVAASGVAAHAGTVQITLTGEQVTTGNTGSFTGDLTGDTTNDVSWSVASGYFARSTGPFIFANYDAAILNAASGRLAYAAYQVVFGPTGGTFSYARAGNDLQSNSPGNPATARALIPFTFEDGRINNNETTHAFADVVAFNTSKTSHTVQIVRTVFDDSNTEAPMGVMAGGSNMDWVPPAPEIDIEGNGNPIADDDTTPSTLDGTDFGNTTVGAPVLHNFLIRNTGTADLSVTMVTAVTGDFGISGGTGTITPGNSLILGVSFTPGSLGAKTATITVTSNDGDESTYTFDVTGTAVSSATPATPSATSVASTVDLQKVKKLKKQLKKAKKSGKKAKAKKIKKQIKKLLAG